MSKKKKALLIVSGLLALMVGITVISVMAIHDLGLFELDRNALDPGGGALPDDWETLSGGGGNYEEFTGIIEDISDPGTQFQGGGSKDNNDISDWLWKEGEPLDKDDITNAYAAAYINTLDTGVNEVGDLIVYFGLDRHANNGSAQVGFWFLQNPIGLTNIRRSGGYEFSGVHAVGDVLMQSNFSRGGVIDNITVYQWVGSGGSHGNLNLEFNAADCVGPPASPNDDPACATVNQVDTAAPWDYTPKFGTEGTFPQGSFFEGGINISRLIPEAGCFTGFLAETRTSTPFSARLKDFAMGDFDLCSIEVEKTGDDLSKVGDDVDYSYTITNTGSITLFRDDISDDVLGDFYLGGVDQSNTFVTGDTCGASLAPGVSCTIDATRTVEGGDPDPLVNIVEVTYRGKSDLTGTAVYGSDDHSVNLFQPSVTVDKTGDVMSKVGDTVTYTYTITNTSSDDSPDLILDSILDSGDNYGGAGLGDIIGDSPVECSPLASGDFCTFDLDYIVQEGDDDPLNNTVVVHYYPDGFPNDITASDSHEVDLFQPSIEVTKSGDTLSKVGDDVNFSVEIENTSSSPSPALVFDLIEDSLQGDLTNSDNYESSACGESLAAGDSCQIDYIYTVQEGDADPLVNVVTVETHPFSFPNDIDDSDDWTVELFQPSITFDKTGDTLSKVGDDVNYTLTLNNTSSGDTPDLECTITDTMLGVNKQVTLASGASDVTNPTYTVQEGDSDPLENTANVTCSPIGFPNVLEASDGHSVNLFQPSITFDKTGDTLSKIGDDVNYTLTLNNTSSGDTPDLECTITDTMLGVNKPVTLASGASDVTNPTYTVQEGDSDPLENTASVTCSPIGYPNVLEASDGHSVNLFQPSITFDKTGSTYSKTGDDVSYTITLNNTSSDDTPDLECTITDALLGIDKSVTLASGASDVTNATHTVTEAEGAGGTLENTASVSCSPVGFPNVLGASDGHSVTLVHPDFTVAKTCDSEPVSYEGPADFTVTIANTGDVPLNITADDGIGAFTLAVGASQSFAVSVLGPFTPGGTADNTVTASWTLPAEYGLSNTDTKSASDSCDVTEPVYETAYGMGGEGENPVCFTDAPYNQGNWGWVMGDGETAVLPGIFTWDVWAGAAQCDTSKGTLVGTVTVDYDAGTGVVSVIWNIDSPNILGDTHVYASYDPPDKFSPGQWENEGPFDGSAIYIIVHAIVAIIP